MQAVPAQLSDTEIVEEIVDLSGEKHGQIKYQVNGDEMTCVSIQTFKYRNVKQETFQLKVNRPLHQVNNFQKWSGVPM